MASYFNIGELVIYNKFYNADVYCIILSKEIHDPGKIKYFKCLAENKIQLICEVWLKKIL